MKLSVIVTAFDKPFITGIHVREVMNSSVLPDEIIVINDCGDPTVRDELLKLEKKTRIVYAYINPPKIDWNYNGACNLGFFISRGDVIAFEDNDNIPMKDFYEKGLKFMEDNQNIGVVFGKLRHDVSVEDLAKPVEEWKVIGNRGPNRGSYLIKRDLFSKLKGHDERFCGRYGFMYYFWRWRLLQNTQFGEAGMFHYVVEGQSNLSHKNNAINYHIYQKSVRENMMQSPIGILNFLYSVEIL